MSRGFNHYTGHKPMGGRKRQALCGAAMCVPAYNPAIDGETDEASGLPLANGTSRLEYSTCPACIEGARAAKRTKRARRAS